MSGACVPAGKPSDANDSRVSGTPKYIQNHTGKDEKSLAQTPSWSDSIVAAGFFTKLNSAQPLRLRWLELVTCTSAHMGQHTAGTRSSGRVATLQVAWLS